LEANDILEVLEHSSDEEVCNYDRGCDVDIFESEESVTSAINSEDKGTEEESVSESARMKRPRLEKQGEWQWGKVSQSYSPRKIPFSEISGPVQCVRSASEAFKLYFEKRGAYCCAEPRSDGVEVDGQEACVIHFDIPQ
jgi:hypothetical protein